MSQVPSMTRTARFVVSLSVAVPTGQTAAVHYTTQDGTAQAPGDYTTTTGTLNFVAGDQTKNIDVPVRSDDIDTAEAFTLVVSQPTGSSGVTVTVQSPGTGTATIPSSQVVAPPSGTEYLDRFQWTWDHVFDPANLYMTAKHIDLDGSGTNTLNYYPPYYASGKDGVFLVEDRLQVNSVDNIFQMTSETMSFLGGMRCWRDVVLNDGWESSFGMFCDPDVLVQTLTLPTPGDGGDDITYYTPEGANLAAYPLTPNTDPSKVGSYSGTLEGPNLLPNVLALPSNGMNTGKFIFTGLGYTAETTLYQGGDPTQPIAGYQQSSHYFDSASNNTIGTETRGRYESVWETLVPYYETEPNNNSHQVVMSQHSKLFVTSVHSDIDGFADTSNYHVKFRNNAYADQMFMHWSGLTFNLQPLVGEVGSPRFNDAEFFDGLILNMYDKYFRDAGNNQQITGASFLGLMNQSYEVETFNYFADGGIPTYRSMACSSDCHQAFQNIMAASMGASGFFNISDTTETAFVTLVENQVFLLRWLQSPEGPFAGGVTNSYNGNYTAPTDGRQNAQFMGLTYTYAPGKVNPPSNDLVEWQTKGHMGTADFFLATVKSSLGDIVKDMECMLDRFVLWFLNNTVTTGTSFTTPTKLRWTSPTPVANQTATAPNTEGTYEYLPSMDFAADTDLEALTDNTNPFWSTTTVPNPNLHCSIVSSGTDLGIGVTLAYILLVYAQAKRLMDKFTTPINVGTGNTKTPEDAYNLAKTLLDITWANYRDDIGITVPEQRPDYSKVNTLVQGPASFTGESIHGGTINPEATFISLRPFLKVDPSWSIIQSYAANTSLPAPSFSYHRTWVQCMFATSNAALHYYFSDLLYSEG